jgi:hypothetical protein
MEMMLDLQRRSAEFFYDLSRIESWEWPAERDAMLARACEMRDAYAEALEACQ